MLAVLAALPQARPRGRSRRRQRGHRPRGSHREPGAGGRKGRVNGIIGDHAGSLIPNRYFLLTATAKDLAQRRVQRAFAKPRIGGLAAVDQVG